MRVFISYSYDSPSHIAWVSKLADDLQRLSDSHIIFDQYDLDHLSDKNQFMERSVNDSDLILVVSTAAYKEKADGRLKGAGYETQLGTQRHLKEIDEYGRSHIILLLRETNSAPRYLASKRYINFTDDSQY